MRVQYKFLVLILCTPRNETAWPRYFQKRNYNILSPSFFTYVSVIDIYIPRVSLPIWLQINECRNWEWGHAVSFLERHKSDFGTGIIRGCTGHQERIHKKDNKGTNRLTEASNVCKLPALVIRFIVQNTFRNIFRYDVYRVVESTRVFHCINPFLMLKAFYLRKSGFN